MQIIQPSPRDQHLAQTSAVVPFASTAIVPFSSTELVPFRSTDIVRSSATELEASEFLASLVQNSNIEDLNVSFEPTSSGSTAVFSITLSVDTLGHSYVGSWSGNLIS